MSATASGDNGNATAGGLVGDGDVVITASYSTGVPTANADAAGTANVRGLAADDATATNSYWDTDASRIPATTTAAIAGTGTSTLALQEHIEYGTTTNPAHIFAMWNLDLDGDDATDDDPWDFGGKWQYPVLQYGTLDPAMQPPKVTLTLSPTSTTEGGEVTLTVALDMVRSSTPSDTHTGRRHHAE